MNGLYYNVSTYGAVGDGTTDSTAAIAQAIADAVAAGGGTVFFPAGTFLTGQQFLYPKVHLLGEGYESSCVKLKAGANTDLFTGSLPGYTDGTICDITRGYTSAGAGLWGTGYAAGCYGWSIRDLTLDGNNSQQTTGSGCGIRVYGYGYILENLHVRNCWSHGIYSDYNPSNSYYNPGTALAPVTNVMTIECQVVNCKFDHNGTSPTGAVLNAGAEGVRWAGPTDCLFTNVVSSRNSSHGFHVGPNGGAIVMVNCHAWGPMTGVGACNYFIEGGDFSSFTNCISDGSDPTGAGVCITAANGMTWTGGMIFGIPNDPAMQGTGLQLGQLAGGTPRPGAVYQSGGVNISGFAGFIRINTLFFDCLTAINFVAEANNSIEATINQAPQYTTQDLATSNATSPTPSVTSASHSFVAGDVGKTLNIISAWGGWLKAAYTITSVSAGAAILSAACGTVATLAYGTWTLADLTSANGTAAAPVVTSGSYTFVAADVGKVLTVTAGTNWTAATYTVASVSAGAATLSAACGSVAALTAGSWTLGGYPLTGNWAGTDNVNLSIGGQPSDGSRALGGATQISALSPNAFNILDGVGNNVLNINSNSRTLQLVNGGAFEMFSDSWYQDPTFKIDTSGNLIWGLALDTILSRSGPGQLAINGGLCTRTFGVTAATYAVLATDSTLFAAAWSNAITLTLPASPVVDQSLVIVKADYTANAVTINGNGKTINGAATQTLRSGWQSIEIQFDGGSWYITSGYAGAGVNPAQLLTAAYSATNLDSVLIADAGGAAFTITLPTAPLANQVITVVKRDAVNTVTIAAAALINGAATQAVGVQWGSLQMQWSPGVGTWYITSVNGAPNPAHVVTATYQATSTDSSIIADAGGAAFTITLPTAPQADQVITVTKRDAVNTVTIAAAALINAAATQAITAQWGSLQMQWAPGPASWYITARI